MGERSVLFLEAAWFVGVFLELFQTLDVARVDLIVDGDLETFVERDLVQARDLVNEQDAAECELVLKVQIGG